MYHLADPKTNTIIIELKEGVTSIRRSHDNTIVLHSSMISRYHAEIKVEGDRITLMALGKTSVNDVKIRNCSLQDGDQLELGPLVYKVVSD